MTEQVNSNPQRKSVRQDFLMDEAYFSKFISFKENVVIPEMTESAKKPGVNAKYDAQFVFKIFIDRCELLIEKYSRGDDIEELRHALPELIEAWEWAHREELKVFTSTEMHRRHGFDVNLDAYNLALWLISIFICLQAEASLFDRLLALIGNEGQDALYERLVATQRPGRATADKLLYPKPYQPLFDAIDEPVKADRDKLLKKFIKGWYQGMRGTYWHDSHKGKDGGGYFGYWCFEAAGVVRAFGMDDAAIRDDPYYPKDMAAYQAFTTPAA
jgi:Domain of unknown function (DUF1911)/Domain of unknown function (DUF1910)